MDKKKLIAAFVKELEKELLAMKAAAQATYEAAVGEESQPENEYDTRGLEASYLAGAQAKRAADIDEVLYLFEHVRLKDFTAKDPIDATALVSVELEGKRSLILLMPKGGGFSLSHEGTPVQVVTPHSLLGEALVGLKVGDFAEVEINDRIREYKILAIS